jgi:hypothetical protein
MGDYDWRSYVQPLFFAAVRTGVSPALRVVLGNELPEGQHEVCLGVTRTVASNTDDYAKNVLNMQ